MGLSDAFAQRKIVATHGSFRSFVQLRTPSGPQETESALETELVEQLNFSPVVYDLITQPILRYQKGGRERRYSPDIYVSLYASPGYALRYLIEVKRADDLEAHLTRYEEKFEFARRWCTQYESEFRVLTERDIRTDYLFNARALSKHLGTHPDEEAFGIILSHTDHSTITVAELIRRMIDEGMNEPSARENIESAVAGRLVYCDMSQRFNDDSQLSAITPDLLLSIDRDPLIKRIAVDAFR